MSGLFNNNNNNNNNNNIIIIIIIIRHYVIDYDKTAFRSATANNKHLVLVL